MHISEISVASMSVYDFFSHFSAQWHNKHNHLVHLSVFPCDQRVAAEMHKTVTAIKTCLLVYVVCLQSLAIIYSLFVDGCNQTGTLLTTFN